ncbi:ABC transporter ATP-binding protein [Furfurilactobacillus curtus]|uniref:Multidrug ABC transporter ATP-binding protein n=1 Tax=Furfurilactobacillus curtus TaxID=1746200 RepID=A0ABQ5JN83_9LACO
MFKLASRYVAWWGFIGALLFLIVQAACNLFLPTITANIIDFGVAKHNLAYIWQTGIIMLIVSLVGVAAAAGNVYFAATQSMRMGRDLRRDLFNRVTYMSNANFDHYGDASLITRTTNDVTQVQNVTVTMLRMMIMAPINLVGAGIMAYLKNKQLTLIFLVVLPILALVVYLIQHASVRLFRSIQGKTDRINLILREGLTGVRVIRAFNRDGYEGTRFNDANQDLTNTSTRAFELVSLMFPIMTLILSASQIAIIWFGAQIIGANQMQIGSLVAFMTYATQILMAFMMLSRMFVFIPRASASATRIQAVLGTVQDIKDGSKANTDKAAASLTFDHVSFSYPDAGRPALTDISFTAHAGQTIAILGGTGAGKSSLINLIPRLYEVSDGAVSVDGVDVRQLTLTALHNQVALNQQTAVLFSGTVRSNLIYGASNATDEQLWAALATAQADDFIKAQGGLDAPVEQDGGNYSGGQRQRLAIARTILKPASVYIFDDSFSALDFETDAKLRQALRADHQVQQAVTVIVAQRISTVVNADLILLLDHGRLLDAGTHEQLKQRNQTYREIIDSQIREGGEPNA